MQPGNLTHYEAGQGPPVVLIHGIASSHHDWDLLAPDLADAGFRTIRVDLFGHGYSPQPDNPEDYNLRTVYTTFETWLHSLGVEEPFHLVGHSLGGYISLRYAIKRPQQVRSITLVNPLYTVAQLTPGLSAFRRRPGLGVHLIRMTPGWVIDRALALDTGNADLPSADLRHQVAEDYKRASPYFLNITRRIPDLTPDLHRVHQPVLLIWGDKDHTLDPSSFPRLAARLPQSTHHRLAGSGHQPHIGKAKEVNQRILTWLSRFSH